MWGEKRPLQKMYNLLGLHLRPVIFSSQVQKNGDTANTDLTECGAPGYGEHKLECWMGQGGKYWPSKATCSQSLDPWGKMSNSMVPHGEPRGPLAQMMFPRGQTSVG